MVFDKPLRETQHSFAADLSGFVRALFHACTTKKYTRRHRFLSDRSLRRFQEDTQSRKHHREYINRRLLRRLACRGDYGHGRGDLPGSGVVFATVPPENCDPTLPPSPRTLSRCISSLLAATLPLPPAPTSVPTGVYAVLSKYFITRS